MVLVGKAPRLEKQPTVGGRRSEVPLTRPAPSGGSVLESFIAKSTNELCDVTISCQLAALFIAWPRNGSCRLRSTTVRNVRLR